MYKFTNLCNKISSYYEIRTQGERDGERWVGREKGVERESKGET
jgi:hypothetical protein